MKYIYYTVIDKISIALIIIMTLVVFIIGSFFIGYGMIVLFNTDPLMALFGIYNAAIWIIIFGFLCAAGGGILMTIKHEWKYNIDVKFGKIKEVVKTEFRGIIACPNLQNSLNDYFSPKNEVSPLSLFKYLNDERNTN